MKRRTTLRSTPAWPCGHAKVNPADELCREESCDPLVPQEPKPLPLGHPFEGYGSDYCYFVVSCEPYKVDFGGWANKKNCGQPESAHQPAPPNEEKA